MTKPQLKALADQLPPDLLFSASAGRAFLQARGVRDPDAALAYVLQAGWWQGRNQFGIQEVWRDGRPEWRATKETPPKPESRRFLPPAPPPVTVAAELPPRPVKVPKRIAPPIAGGLFETPRNVA
ncbi:MAG: hypothetical protein NVS3B25_34450 [Hymenobacter sp.]